MATISDLPDEILVDILKHAISTHRCLTGLQLVCHRFRIVAEDFWEQAFQGSYYFLPPESEFSIFKNKKNTRSWRENFKLQHIKYQYMMNNFRIKVDTMYDRWSVVVPLFFLRQFIKELPKDWVHDIPFQIKVSEYWDRETLLPDSRSSLKGTGKYITLSRMACWLKNRQRHFQIEFYAEHNDRGSRNEFLDLNPYGNPKKIRTVTIYLSSIGFTDYYIFVGGGRNSEGGEELHDDYQEVYKKIITYITSDRLHPKKSYSFIPQIEN